MNRRKLLDTIFTCTVGAICTSSCALRAPYTIEQNDLKLSLAEWSLNKSIFGKKMDHLDFAKKSKELGFHAIEYVNQFFKNKAEDSLYLSEMNTRCRDQDITQLLIMIDREGYLADQSKSKRREAVENHYKWVDAAKYLGCHSIRVNAFGEGSSEDVKSAAVEGLSLLAEYGAKENINIIVENHGSYSSDGSWLASLMKEINMDNCGTLPDFGNFCIERKDGAMWGTECIKEYDKYQGVKEMMPYAKAVSAKSFDFNRNGEEMTIDFAKMINIIKEAKFSGYIGIEYEGDSLSEEEGIIATKKLLESLI